MTSILIYQDYVHNNGSLLKALSAIYGHAQVRFVDADDIKNGALNPQVKAFFMPGGASRYVADKLDGTGNQKIKDYVASGGLYVGICAGAYYACKRTEWLAGQEHEICVDNELGFFPGIAKGPIDQFVDGEYMTKVTTLVTDNGEEIKTMYWAGPLFVQSNEDYEVLARYKELPDQPPAIITGKFGKGKYLLCSPHAEIASTQLKMMTFDVSHNKYADIATILDIEGMDLDYFTSLIRQFVV